MELDQNLYIQKQDQFQKRQHKKRKMLTVAHNYSGLPIMQKLQLDNQLTFTLSPDFVIQQTFKEFPSDILTVPTNIQQWFTQHRLYVYQLLI